MPVPEQGRPNRESPARLLSRQPDVRVRPVEGPCREDSRSRGAGDAVRRAPGDAESDRAASEHAGETVEVEYLAFPEPVALSAALGPDWATRAKTIEFRALDGYVSRIDVARLTSGTAYFAFARADRSPFVVDNLTQNEKNVPLGPYYLVWDNRSDPKLLAAGARDWPYQVDDVLLFNASDAALRPDSIPPSSLDRRTSRRIA